MNLHIVRASPLKKKTTLGQCNQHKYDKNHRQHLPVTENTDSFVNKTYEEIS